MIGAALVCVFAGAESMMCNCGSYSNTFSSVLRATRGATFDNAVPKDDDATSPVPKELANLQIQIGTAKCRARIFLLRHWRLDSSDEDDTEFYRRQISKRTRRPWRYEADDFYEIS